MMGLRIETTTTNYNLTKKTLLQKYSQEQIMEYYTGIPLQRGAFCSPFKTDRNPSCSYYYKGDRLFICDHRGYFFGDCFSVAAKSFGLTNNGDINGNDLDYIIHRVYNDIKNKTLPDPILIEKRKKRIEKKAASTKDWNWVKVKWSKTDYEYWTPLERTFWCDIETREIHSNLDKIGVFPISHLWIDGYERVGMRYEKDDPTYIYRIKMLDGTFEYKAYKPQAKDKKYKWRSTSCKGKLVIQNLDQVMNNVFDKLFWCTSKKDGDSINIIHEWWRGFAFASEAVIPEKLPEELIRCRYYFADNDIPGLRQAVKVKRRFPHIKIVWIPRMYLHNHGIKDVTDLLEFYGETKAKAFIQNLL